MTLCKIEWADTTNKLTPDQYPAAALAVCYNPILFGEKGSEPLPICESHMAMRSADPSLTQVLKFWKFLPLLGQDMKDAHLLVRQDDKYFHIIPNIVRDALVKAFPRDAEDILINGLRWSSDHWSFSRWGMYVGVEVDGYIHT